MAYVVLVIEDTRDNITQLNSKVNYHVNGNQREGVILARNYIESILAGVTSAQVQVTTRDTDPAVSTSGSGSEQHLYNLK